MSRRRRAPRLRSLATLVAVVGSLLLCLSCDERFEFDRVTNSAVAGSGGSAGAAVAGTAGSAGDRSAGGSLGGGGAGGSSGAGAGGSAGAAGGCGAHAACPGSQRCIEGDCYQCEVDADCAATSYPQCHPERHRCVACVSPDDCPDDFTCDFRTNKCVHTCQDEIDCPAEVPGCEGGLCFKCDGDRDCVDSPLGSFCAADRSGCVRCRDADDCPDLCDRLMGRCVECLDGRDCDSGICELTTGACLPG